jgi:hypothetical protein
MPDTPILSEWLDKRISIAEAEAANVRAADSRSEKFPDLLKPFGMQNSTWQKLKDQMQPDDELWTFFSPAETWRNLRGMAGVVLVRDGKTVEFILTMVN